LWSTYTKKKNVPWTADFAEQYQKQNPEWNFNFQYTSWDLELARLLRDPAWKQPQDIPNGSQRHPGPYIRPPTQAPSPSAPITTLATLASGSGGNNHIALVLERFIRYEREFYRGGR
jgi:hypothetical protein